jgi:16S rRNA C967 or C1407 C5-methylase (RsmB/RsmF family)
MLLVSLLILSSSIVCSSSDLSENSQQVFASNMTKTKRPQPAPLDTFENHFASAARYGERWHQTLYPAMKGESRYTALYNRYAPIADFHRVVGPADSLERVHFPSAADDIQADNLLCFTRKQDHESNAATLPAAEKASNGILTHEKLDAASLLAIHILQVVPGDNVLDLCAIPSGNSVALAQPIWPYLYPDSTMPPLIGAKKGSLHSNELDPNRNRRLAETLTQYLPVSVISSGQQKVIRVDGTKGVRELPLGSGGYDKVLVDVPSSNERLIVQAQEKASQGRTSSELTNWNPSSSKHMAEVQVQLLMTALRAVRVGGRVVYSTRSISREENDGVVEKAIMLLGKEAKKGSLLWTAEVEKLDGEVERRLEADWAEKTAKGWAVLPDNASGGKWGPLYFSVLTKKSM